MRNKSEEERLNSLLNEGDKLLKLLASDLRFSVSEFSDDPNRDQFSRRLQVKNFVSTVEGLIYVFKYLLVEIAWIRHVFLSEAEIAMLREQNFRLDDKGKAITTPAKLKTKDNLQFLLNVVSKVTGLEKITVDSDNKGWKSFLLLLEVRNRITHPKSAAEMEIPDDEYKNVDHAGKWLIRMVKEISRDLSHRSSSAQTKRITDA